MEVKLELLMFFGCHKERELSDRVLHWSQSSSEGTFVAIFTNVRSEPKRFITCMGGNVL